MMRRLAFAVVLLALAVPAFAQNPLVGTWEQIEETMNGKVKTSDRQRVVYFFLPDGHWAWLVLPPERPEMNKRADEMSKEELLAHYRGVFGGWGTYAVSGDKLSRRLAAAVTQPSGQKEEDVQSFRIEADELTVTAPRRAGVEHRIRLRRLK